MRYALLYYEAPAAMARRRDPATVESYWASWMDYMTIINERGIMQSGAGLEPPETRTVLRSGESGRIVEDGPFAEAREELGGFVIVEVPDIDAALEIAGMAPCAKPGAGHVEIRPVLPSGGRRA